ncbi:Os12g0555700 [Oryza sativa Japonica Group]|uniref:Os12g0555700 protein n=1 Tax=Oryza sativa subsp. japonica TaxID=39947 RepID=A0A0P0YBN0_ORYSJ|nr:Os12g0555700 [Oryza sativa Japonica Group]
MVAGKAPAEETGQGVRWPDLVAVVPEHDDHHHDVVHVLLGGEHRRLKPVDGAKLDLRRPTPTPRRRSYHCLLPLLVAALAGQLPWRCRARERGTGEREKEREERGGRGILSLETQWPQEPIGAMRCLPSSPGKKTTRDRSPSQGARGLARGRRRQKY